MIRNLWRLFTPISANCKSAGAAALALTQAAAPAKFLFTITAATNRGESDLSEYCIRLG